MPDFKTKGNPVFPPKETIRFPDEKITGPEIETEYIVSALERLDSMEEEVLLWEKDLDNPSHGDGINRWLHSIKGDSGFMGLPLIVQVIHDMESLVTGNPNDPPISELLAFKDWLSEALEHLRRKPHGEFGGVRSLMMTRDAHSQSPIKEVLSGMGEFQTASNAQEVLNRFQNAWKDRQPYNLVCLPTGAPEKLGHQVLQSIREKEEEWGVLVGRGAAVVMMSEVKDPKDVFRAFNLGCDAYLIKPFTKEKFLKELSKLKWPRMND